MKKYKKNKTGITLVALVITIVILLILAGISISALTNQGLFGKAKQAESKSKMADARELIVLTLNEWHMDNVSNGTTIDNFFNQKVIDNEIDSFESGDDEGTYNIYKNGYVLTVDSKGNIVEDIQKAGPKPKIQNIKITTKDGVEVTDDSVKIGTPLVINFDSSIENGTIKSVTPAVPYTTNGTETEVKFVIIGTVGGTDYKKTLTVSINKKYKEAFNGTTVEEAIRYGYELSSSKNIELKDEKNNKIVIPAGFKVTADATTVDKGIVIEDDTSKATAGSQFVWIPVGTITKVNETKTTISLGRYDFSSSTGVASSYYGGYVEEDSSKTSTLQHKGNTIAKNITNFKNSVTDNGGYYIGRYEARTTSKRTSAGNVLTQITEKGTDQIYNYITQQQAASQAQNMYDNTNPFTSDLMNSYAWDTAITFIQKCAGKTNYSIQIRLSDSLSQTGTTADKQCNIFDMAGNVVEWTTETSDDSGMPYVFRGGNYSYDINYTGYRDIGDSSYSWPDLGFRPILYL